MSVFQCMNIQLQFLFTVCFSFPVYPQNLNLSYLSVECFILNLSSLTFTLLSPFAIFNEFIKQNSLNFEDLGKY